MKILFCSHNALDPRLGAPKALIEIASQLDRLGWQSRLASDVDICPDIRNMGGGIRAAHEFSRSLAGFLERNSGDFDVVEYDHSVLPGPSKPLPRRVRSSSLASPCYCITWTANASPASSECGRFSGPSSKGRTAIWDSDSRYRGRIEPSGGRT